MFLYLFDSVKKILVKAKVHLTLLSAKMATTNIPGVFFANSSHRKPEMVVTDFEKTFCAYLVVIVAIAIPAQLFVIRAILRKEQLKTPIHRILLQIAINDLLFSFWFSTYCWMMYFGNGFFAWKYSCNFFEYPNYVFDTVGIFFCAFVGFMLFTRHLTFLYANVISCAIWIGAMILMRDMATNTSYWKPWFDGSYRCLNVRDNEFNLQLLKETMRIAVAVAIILVLPLLSRLVRGRFWIRNDTNEMLLIMVLLQITFTSGTALVVTKMNLLQDYTDENNIVYYDGYLFMLSFIYRPFHYVCFCRHFRSELKELRESALVRPETFSLRNREGFVRT